MVIQSNQDNKYESLRLRTRNENNFLQSLDVDDLVYRDGNYHRIPGLEEVASSFREYIFYEHSLIPSSRKFTLRDFKGLVSKIEDVELKEVVEDNISYLKERGTPSQRTKEIAATVAYYGISLIFPLLLQRRR